MLSLTIPNFNLNDIYESGIVWNWKRVDENWYIMHTDTLACAVKQYGDKKVFYCSEAEFFDVWYYYFTVDIDYVPAYRHLFHFKNQRMNDLIKKHKGMRLIRMPLNETIIRAVVSSMVDYPSDVKYLWSSILNNIGIIQRDLIQNVGVQHWKNMPPIKAFKNFTPEVMYDINRFGTDIAERLIELSENDNEKQLTEKLIDTVNSKHFEDVPDLLWTMGLKDDEVGQVMLFSLAQLDNCPDSLIEDAIDLLYGVSPISYHEWYMDDLGVYYGLFGTILRCAFNMGDVTDKLTDKLGYQLKLIKQRQKKRNPWERREIEGEETWD